MELTQGQTIDWLTHTEIPIESDTALQALSSTEKEVLFHGKVRTSKTRLGLKRLIGLHMKNRGMKSCIVRQNNVDMNGSIRSDIRELCKYGLTDTQAPIRSYGGQNFTNLFLNDGECRLIGLNQDQHILGTEYDVIFLSQLDQIDEESYQKLLTRLSGKAIRKPNGSYFRQVIADANPSEPDHFMYRRESAQQLKVIEFDFEDNPRFFRRNRWTKDGYDYIKDLKKGLSGLNYDRYFLGLRVSAAGAVFELMDCHFINTLPDLRDYHRYLAVDFGWTAPSVVLWIAWNHIINDVIVYREWRTNNEDTISLGTQINQFNEMFGEKIEDVIIDNDEDKKATLRKYCNISARMVKKFPGSRLAGYNHIHHALKCTALGEPGGLRFYTKMLYRSDVDKFSYEGPENLIKELRTVKFSETKLDEIEKEGDHGPDGLAYFFLEKMRPKIKGTFKSATATVKKKHSRW